MSAEEVKQETYDFEADVPQVMSIIINSVYSSKELFLRELISNASDAISKLMTEKQKLEDAGYPTVPMCNYKIQVISNPKEKTLTIRDNGIGMTKADLKNFLGSIASSGTKKFREAFDKSKDKNIDALIGQFGLGFYSSFLVAERVDVLTKHPKDEGYVWSSNGSNTYSIAPYSLDEHGTSVILKLKDGEEEYLKADRLTDLIKKHNMYIKYKIVLVTEKEPEKKESKEGEVEGEVEEIKEETKEEKQVEEKVINNEIPVWTRKVEEIPEEDLRKFYKTLSNDYDDYAAVQSWHFEGMIDLKILLFIPKKARMNFFERNNEKNNNIKLFNSNVFVTDDLGKDVVPDWMNFVVGAVSSSDFPMNVSREFLQGKSTMNLLKNKLPKCIAEMIKKLERDSAAFDKFYKEFSSNIKLAVRQYTDTQQESFARFLRYYTNKDNKKMTSLEEYLERNPQSKQILILTGLNKREVENSLYLEGYQDREVLLMHEAVDEIMLQGLKTFQSIPFQMISSEGVLELNESPDTKAEDEKEEPKGDEFIEFVKDLLKDKVEKVEYSTKFANLPGILLTTKYSSSSAMENIIKSHPGAESNPMMMMMMQTRKIFVLNPEHSLVNTIKNFISSGDKEGAKRYIMFVFNSALLGLGFSMEDKPLFVKRLYEIIGSSGL